MSVKVDQVDVPAGSRISASLVGAYYFDAYRFTTSHNDRTPLQIWLDHMSKTPAWVNALMAARNKVVAAFGLKNLGRLGDVDIAKPTGSYQVGDRVGIFTVFSVSNTEVILEDSDKHLDVKVSIYKESEDGRKVEISTVVHVHNMLGRVYMLFITPIHKLIVPASIKRAESISGDV